MDTEILEKIGMSDSEIKIYLALLELGSSKTGEIIGKTGLQSSTVYHVLENLKERGLVSYILKGKVKYFQAESPDVFSDILEEMQEGFNNLLPKLKRKEASSKKKLGAEIFEGYKGLKAAFNDILDSLDKEDEYYFFSSPSQNINNENWQLFFRNYHLKRAEKGIKVKGLSSPENKEDLKEIFEGIRNTKIRFIEEFAPTGIVIYKNKIITIEWKESPVVFVLKSESIANSYRDFFEKMWEKAR